MSGVALGWGIAGLLMLTLTWACWTGRWRAWAESPLAASRPLLIAGTSGFAVFGLSYPFWAVLPPPAGSAVFGVGWFALIAGVALMLWSPQWFGPRWFREFRRAFYDSAWNSRSWMSQDWRRPGESSVDATHRHMSSERPMPPGVVWVRLHANPHGLVGGRTWRSGSLGYYPQAPVASVTRTPISQDPAREEIIPVEAMTGVCRLPPGTTVDGSSSRAGVWSWLVPRVRIDTTEGPWLFEIPRAKRAVQELQRRYLDPPDGPEPSWILRDGQPAKENQLERQR